MTTCSCRPVEVTLAVVLAWLVVSAALLAALVEALPTFEAMLAALEVPLAGLAYGKIAGMAQ